MKFSLSLKMKLLNMRSEPCPPPQLAPGSWCTSQCPTGASRRSCRTCPAAPTRTAPCSKARDESANSSRRNCFRGSSRAARRRLFSKISRLKPWSSPALVYIPPSSAPGLVISVYSPNLCCEFGLGWRLTRDLPGEKLDYHCYICRLLGA